MAISALLTYIYLVFSLVKSPELNIGKHVDHTREDRPLDLFVAAAVLDVDPTPIIPIAVPTKGVYVKSANFDILSAAQAARKRAIWGHSQILTGIPAVQLDYYQNSAQITSACDPTCMAIMPYQPLVNWTIDAHTLDIKQDDPEVPKALTPVGPTVGMILMLATKAIQNKQPEVKEVATPKPRTRLGLNKVFLRNLVANQKMANDRRARSSSLAFTKLVTSLAQAPTSVTPKSATSAQSTPPIPSTPTPSRHGNSASSKRPLSGGVRLGPNTNKENTASSLATPSRHTRRSRKGKQSGAAPSVTAH